MVTVTSLFIHTEPLSILRQLLDVISGDKLAYRDKLTSPSDISADAGLNSAQTLLEQAAKANDESTRSTYIIEADQYLQLVMSMGFGPVLVSPPTQEGREKLARIAPSLSLLPILAESYLGGTSWALRDREAGVRYLASAHEKSKAAANTQKIRLESVNEEVLVFVDESRELQVGWSYVGRRPVEGTMARLSQDIEFALVFLQTGEVPQPLDIYGKWEQIISA